MFPIEFIIDVTCNITVRVH